MEKIKLIAMCIGFFIVGCIFLVGLCVIMGGINEDTGTKHKRNQVLKNDSDTPKKKRYVTFTKRWFAIILKWGIVWVNLSYILAFLGKEQIAESLSTAAITTILGAFITYALKSFGEKKIGKEKEDDYENDFTEIDQ